jgi:hypothetical protein
MSKTLAVLLTTALTGALSGAASAQTVSTTTSTAPAPSAATSPATTRKDTPAQARLVNAFSDFAGSESNARSLVTGLRQGGEVTLEGAGTTQTFTPETRPMGYGNVRIALSLAREQLAQQGITQPTPAQLQAALQGGTVTSGGQTAKFPGVLQMRADGMGWGQIANSMGVKLGHVMSGRPAPAPAVEGTPGGSGVVSAAGKPAGTEPAHRASPAGRGIVTATGGPAGSAGGGARHGGGHGAGHAAGIVSGAGAQSGANSGRGFAKGHAR